MVAASDTETHPSPDSYVDVRDDLVKAYADCALAIPYRPTRYDSGDRLTYDMQGVWPPWNAQATVRVERFVGGGFAGQVYRVTMLGVTPHDESRAEPITGLEIGQSYALKLLRPPSPGAARFRDFLFALGYQAPFSPQVNPAAIRSGTLWQKLIRRAAGACFREEGVVCDTFATLYDERLATLGVLNEWVDGRIWKFEVDNRLFHRWRFSGKIPPDHNCPEYVGKRLFMRRLVNLLHEMGASELARQYEWWTCKSQPNALRRLSTSSGEGGLTAIDFASGLVLLPLLPMSPADVCLIVRGLARGRWVQFDRGDLRRLRSYVASNSALFEGMGGVLDELEEQDARYRASQPDVTHHGVRLLTDRTLRSGIRRGAIQAWLHLGYLDAAHAASLSSRTGAFRLLYAVSWIPLVGKLILRLWGESRSREHAARCLRSPSYLCRAFRGDRAATLIQWARGERITPQRARALLDKPVRFAVERVGLSWLPPVWHRSLAEPSWAWRTFKAKLGRAIRFLRDPAYREEQLLSEVREGREEGMLTDSEADRVIAQIKDPYIQKYLRCLAVHICTLFISEVTVVIVTAAVTLYCLLHRGMPWAASLGAGGAAAAAMQLLPISLGSLTRGVYVVFIMIKERDIKNYYIAAPISFIRIVGYLAFPLQMVSHDPALARFLAGRWTRRMVRIIPVFGEHGALLEHGVFDAFFNLPLSLARLMRRRKRRTAPGAGAPVAS